MASRPQHPVPPFFRPSISECWAWAQPAPPGHTVSPHRGACSFAVNVDHLFLSVLWQKSPSRPWTKPRPTAVPSGPSSASSSRSSSWAGSTLSASGWYVSATQGPAGLSRMSTSVGPPTCPSTSSPRAPHTMVPSQVRSLACVRALGRGGELVWAGYGVAAGMLPWCPYCAHGRHR